jgi:hypothetical protein
MSSRSSSDIKTRAEGVCISDKDQMRMFYRAHKTTHLMSSLNIGEVILKINIVLAQKIKAEC